MADKRQTAIRYWIELSVLSLVIIIDILVTSVMASYGVPVDTRILFNVGVGCAAFIVYYIIRVRSVLLSKKTQT